MRRLFFALNFLPPWGYNCDVLFCIDYMTDSQHQNTDSQNPVAILSTNTIDSRSVVKIPRPYNDVIMRLFVYILAINCGAWALVPCTFFVASPLVVGYFVAQLAIISTLLTLGPGKFWERFLCWYGVFFAWISSAAMLPLMMFASDSTIVEYKTFVGYVLLLPAGLLAIQFPLWIARFFRSWRMVQQCDEGELPFSVSNFLAGAVIVAISIALFQTGLGLIEIPTSEQTLFSLAFFGISILGSTILLVPTVYLMFDASAERANIPMILLVNYCGWLLISIFIAFFLQNQIDFEPVWALTVLLVSAMFATGYVVTILILNHLLYRADVRLVTSGRRQGELVFVESNADQVDVFDDDVQVVDKKTNLATEDEIRFQ